MHTTGGLIGTCLLVGSLAFLFELLRYLQAKHRQRELILRSRQLRTICPSDSATLLTTNKNVGATDPRNPLNITIFDR